MTTQPIQDVSETALMVAMWRAAENDHPAPLFRDPLALKLAGRRGEEIISGLPKSRASMSRWMMAIRTRIIDDLIGEAVAGGVDLVLNLGAGLDTRPYRMTLPRDLKWVEVDRARIIDLKARELAAETPACHLERLSCDLADQAARRALLETIGKKAKRALVLTEGVIPYLTEAEVGELAADLKGYPAFRYWIADYFSPFVVKCRQGQTKKMRMENAPFKFEPEDYFGFFLAHGWRSIVEAARRLGRLPPLGVRAWFAARGLFMSREQREQRKNSWPTSFSSQVPEPVSVQKDAVSAKPKEAEPSADATRNSGSF